MKDTSSACKRVCFVFTKLSVDVGYSLVHGHVNEASAQAVMGEEQQHSLQELVEFVESLDTKQPWRIVVVIVSVAISYDGLTVVFSKRSRMKVMALLLMPMKRLMHDKETYAVLGMLNT